MNEWPANEWITSDLVILIHFAKISYKWYGHQDVNKSDSIWFSFSFKINRVENKKQWELEFNEGIQNVYCSIQTNRFSNWRKNEIHLTLGLYFNWPAIIIKKSEELHFSLEKIDFFFSLQ